eukprot:2128996-Pyramimonas_sp.AAC.1
MGGRHVARAPECRPGYLALAGATQPLLDQQRALRMQLASFPSDRFRRGANRTCLPRAAGGPVATTLSHQVAPLGSTAVVEAMAHRHSGRTQRGSSPRQAR